MNIYRNKIQLLMCFDNRYCQHAAATIISAIYNNKSPIDFHILYRNISRSKRNKLEKLVVKNGSRIFFYKIPRSEYKNFPIEKNSPVTVETYFRILAVKYLPDNLDRVLYIDTDVLILQGISELFRIDLENFPVAAVPGYAPPQRQQALGMSPPTKINICRQECC